MSLIKTILSSLRLYAKRTPWLFRFMVTLKYGRKCDRIISKATDIVIEGFPRSGNTFGVQAFRISQGNGIKIAHHFHSQAQLVIAAKWGIPAISLIREPKDAIASAMVFDDSIAARRFLRDYIHFYETILPYKKHFVTANFDDVVSDFGSIIKRVNAKFGTDFTAFEHNEENVATLFSMIEGQAEALSHGSAKVARPEKARQGARERALEAMAAPKLRPLLAAAEQVYRDMRDESEAVNEPTARSRA